MLIAYVGGIPTTWFITHWEKSEVVPAHWEVGPDWPMKLRAEWIQTAEMMAKVSDLCFLEGEIRSSPSFLKTVDTVSKSSTGMESRS